MYLKKYISKTLKSQSDINILVIYVDNNSDSSEVSSSKDNEDKLSYIKDQVFQ